MSLTTSVEPLEDNKVRLHVAVPAEDFELHRGDRIAQLVIQRVEHVRLVEVDDLDASARGVNGWGSSGRR